MILNWFKAFASLCLTLALTGCGGVSDVLRYEAGITRIKADRPLGEVAPVVPPDAALALRLRQAGFTTYMRQTGEGPVTGWARPGISLSDPVAIKSVSKVLVTAAFAIEEARGTVSWQTPLTRIGGCDVPPALRPLTPAMLANMSAGFKFRENETISVYAAPNWACNFFSQPVEAQSGVRFNYATAQTHLLGLHLSEATGLPLDQLVQSRVLGPMGVTLDGWTLNQDGDVMGGSEMLLHPHDMLIVGRTFRDAGRADGRRVVPLDFVRRAARHRFPDAGRPGIGYGWGWWQTNLGGTPVHFAEGYGGQVIAIVPRTGTIHVFSAPTGGLVSPATHDARIAVALEVIEAGFADAR